ncbi:hypothetical protein EMWEY_00045580 [Eimeria maxima]|uniref:Uncharacterized protein n=1 Tax=Eimeria maxima TaxID=5804 RepID=U6MC82_EIMMA|nr:hypothetical protein EMWEY_00045580 [Eimeria maxima]CDJ61847.1 hypothetical protein EMWEY_00045580 [Eimeria maxima]
MGGGRVGHVNAFSRRLLIVALHQHPMNMVDRHAVDSMHIIGGGPSRGALRLSARSVVGTMDQAEDIQFVVTVLYIVTIQTTVREEARLQMWGGLLLFAHQDDIRQTWFIVMQLVSGSMQIIGGCSWKNA